MDNLTCCISLPSHFIVKKYSVPANKRFFFLIVFRENSLNFLPFMGKGFKRSISVHISELSYDCSLCPTRHCQKYKAHQGQGVQFLTDLLNLSLSQMHSCYDFHFSHR